ncbi:hypothetical protein FisN_10Lh150 [Fistulifera solaris]|uniref:RING-type domain-containing protein n=1 Tax=Fistulifera solaris TaxID=1519565 RepID=A0A1Z5JU57_FISSO|nr:hypothetical protein FisN_10Lh150 [Fistulifera solaris]|eukprot:GAX17291.1 hypothetical protein FisN_10Lh150 [Fistulifera solaris]
MSTSRWQALRQRTPPWKRALYIAGLASCLVLYTYTFFSFSPDRSRDVILKMNAEKQMHYEAERNSTAPPDAEVKTGKSKSLASRLVDVALILYSLNILTRFLIRIWLPGAARSRLERRAQRLLREQREQRFLDWVDGLNTLRRFHGQRPMSVESLRLVMRERDMTGEDYDSLLQFNEEAGPAVGALLNQMGASPEEIRRLPSRTLTPTDDILKSMDHHQSRCAICLENYQIGELIRTVPCLHSFHSNCIDRWLADRALCPICKQPAVG